MYVSENSHFLSTTIKIIPGYTKSNLYNLGVTLNKLADAFTFIIEEFYDTLMELN